MNKILILLLLWPSLLAAQIQKVSGIVPLTALATDVGCGVQRVQFFLDGVPLGPALTVPPYVHNWNTAGISEGIHTIRALAYDRSGGASAAPGQECNGTAPNVSEPAIKTLEVDNIPVDTAPPTIQITTPTASSNVSGNRVEINVAASDPSGVNRIQLFIDDQLRSTAITDRLNIRWNSNQYRGRLVPIRAEATDTFGNGPSVHAIQVQVRR